MDVDRTGVRVGVREGVGRSRVTVAVGSSVGKTSGVAIKRGVAIKMGVSVGGGIRTPAVAVGDGVSIEPRQPTSIQREKTTSQMNRFIVISLNSSQKDWSIGDRAA